MTYKSERVRVAAVSYYAAKYSGVSPVQHLRSMLDADAYADIKAPTQFIRDVVTKWQHHGEVVNLFSTRVSSHPKKVPDEVIRKCATIIKAGYNVELLVASGSGQVSGQSTWVCSLGTRWHCQSTALISTNQLSTPSLS
jgi:hypothetical protein